MNADSFIHRYISADQAGAATLLLLHGTGGDENDLIEIGQLLAPNANLLSPRGKVTEGTAARFFRRHSPGVLDIDDLIVRSVELRHFIDEAANEYSFDRERVIAVGYSNGANIAAGLLLLHPGALAGAILYHPMLPLEPEQPPELVNVPVFIGAGRLDPIVPMEQVEALERYLRNAGADVQLNWQPGGHQLTQAEVQSSIYWLQQHDLV